MSNKYRGRIVQEDNTIFISATSLQSFTSCPRQGYYNKILRLRPKVPVYPAALHFGSAVHSALEYYLRTGSVVDFAQFWDPYSALPLEYHHKNEMSHGNLQGVGTEIIERMIETLDMLNAEAPYTYVDKEGNAQKTIEFQSPVLIAEALAFPKGHKYNKVGRVVLVRTIDAFLPVSGVPTVIDFKTTAREYTEGLQDDVSEQLTAYLLPHNLEGVPQPAQAAFITGTKLTRQSSWFPTKRSLRRLRALKEDLLSVALMIREGIYPRCRGRWTCGSERLPMCEYRPICYDYPDYRYLYIKDES